MALVLILNHDPGACEAQARLLAAAGHQVRCCGSPGQALRRIRLLRIELLWVAIPLAGMEEKAFLRRVFQLRPGLAVVAIAEAAMDAVRLRQCKQEWNSLGVRVVLRGAPKPHLLIAVTDILARELASAFEA